MFQNKEVFQNKLEKIYAHSKEGRVWVRGRVVTPIKRSYFIALWGGFNEVIFAKVVSKYLVVTE